MRVKAPVAADRLRTRMLRSMPWSTREPYKPRPSGNKPRSAEWNSRGADVLYKRACRSTGAAIRARFDLFSTAAEAEMRASDAEHERGDA